MSKIPIIVRKEYFERLKSKGFIISTILIPLFLTGSILIPLAITMLGSSGPKPLIAFSDRTGEVETSFLEQMKPLKEIVVVPVSIEDPRVEDQIFFDIERRVLLGYLSIRKTADGNYEATYTARTLTDPVLVRTLQQAVKTAINTVRLKSAGLSDPQIRALETPVAFLTHKIQAGKESEESAAAQFVLTYVMVFLIYGTTLIYGIQVMNSVIDEKSSRIMEVLISSVRPVELMAGKVIGIGLVALTQYLIWTAAGVLILGAGLPELQRAFMSDFTLSFPPMLIVYFILYFVLGYLLYASLYAAIGSVIENPQDAQSLQTPVTMLVIIPVFVLSFVTANPDAFLSTVLSLIPAFSPVLMMARIGVSEVPVWQIALSFVLMSLTIFGTTLLAGKIYRVGVLMYGKKPKISEILKWIRHS
ncbi:MAG: ABC transporter permease [Chlorobiales bacterium]|nr:ABC transporter permease [Chlorobiales bacterium]